MCSDISLFLGLPHSKDLLLKAFYFLSEFLKATQRPLIWEVIIWSPSLSQEFVINDAMNKHTKEKHDFFFFL